MSFVDDFVYKVKTGRLFAGSKSKIIEIQTTANSNKEAINEISQQIKDMGSQMEILETIKRDFSKFETQIEVLDEMNHEFSKFETKLDSLKETNKEVSTVENESANEAETQEETIENAQPAEQKTEIKEEQQPLVIKPSVKKQIGPDVVIHFVFMDKKYVVEKFNINFRQDMNTLRNRPDSFTYGGTMEITLSGFLDSTLEEWMTQTYLTRDGEIRFLPNMPKITDSSLLTIFFSDAYCTACNKTMDVETSGVLSTLTVSPRRIRMGNEEFENKWKKKEPLEFTIRSV